ncbi:hypothetical protein [Dyella lutea]|uniref:XRE family transcriptional regulator n=1 Tax=Dyella lutea TaxID=2950441 RepID=A0ABT1FIQ4_9GAMM|nr:hypothetical protein [Dyella lutea]MCP1376008.1 hypothetical protein [Dyella lutea]
MQQLSLTFEPGLAQRYANVRECFAACVYQRGLGRVAAACDVAPSNLSAMLSGDRNLPTDVVERYQQEFKDNTPSLYMAARYCQDAQTIQQQAMAQLPGVLAQLQALMAAAGTVKA